jgi:periplasmic divalent cation tolerance protein
MGEDGNLSEKVGLEMKDQAIVVMVTVPDRETGQKIARELVNGRLAACVNILPAVESVFTWEDRINVESEVLLLIKSRSSLFKEGLLPAVLALHPYQVPEVIALPVEMGHAAYLDWILESTRSNP